ncbi:AAA family ATPase [Nocardia sp. NPDC059091]|uniref:bifunctional aminoglycoside phosphotransferase/ATP-binding protein n=1 Tax=Nocardia sp. NPDC059091 TaxID=3346724 RepID=UPI0036A541FD
MDTNASTSRPVVRPDDLRQRAVDRAAAAEHLRSGTRHDARAAELRETHTGLVVLVGDRAYKVKKPIVTDFLDFATTEAREHALRRELELNRRWAPDVYLGLDHLTGPLDSPGEPVLIMRRMPESRRLSRLVTSGAIGRAELSELATVVARFHRNASRSSTIDQAGTAQALRQRWRIVLRGPRSHPLSALDPLLVDRIERLAMRFIDGRSPLLAERIADGRILDGHGDLLTEDIFALPDGFRILDCLDFDDSLRAVDGLDDAAFLAMDLEFLGRPQLAEDFLTDYLRAAGDSPPASLRHHYIAYRAMVRAKTNHIRAAQGDEHFVGHAIRHLDLAVRHLEVGAVRLALVGGLPGTGKSTVATRLAEATGAEVISSDTVRTRLRASGAITGASGGLDAGAYRPDARSLVYTHMLELARQRLALGVSVILDASWIDAAERTRARALAAHAHAELIPLRCECPPQTYATRIRTRRPGDSEATPDIAHALATTSSPWPDATTVDTTTSIDATVAQALREWNAVGRSASSPDTDPAAIDLPNRGG